MNINLNFDLSIFTSGVIAGLVFAGGISNWWLLGSALMLADITIKGFPYFHIKYDNDAGWHIEKGFHK